MSSILEILTWILILYMFTSVSARWEWESGANPHLISDQEPRPKPTTRLSNPLIGDDGKIYVCLEKHLLVFQNNGSISRRIPLNYTCNIGITPVLGASRKVYLVAGNRVLRINIRNTQTPESSGEVFLGPETGVEGMDEIIGLSVSTFSSCVLININRRGLFSYRFDGKLHWSTGPLINRMGYRQGCRKNLTNCYFDSVPAIDNCDANIYVSNNQGELYSLSIRSPHFKWIQDYSSLGSFTVTAGNNGRLYLTVPDRAVILGLDISNGSVLWQQSVGPLSARDSAPLVNVNGWISIGSLDGFLYSISPSGVLKKFPETDVVDAASRVNLVLDCSGYAVYISQTNLEGKISRIIGEYSYVSAMKPVNTSFKLLVPATGSVYWSESYPGSLSSLFSGSDLRRFVMDEKMLLAFLSISNTGNPLSCFSTRQKLASSCSMMEMKPVSIDTGNEKASTIFLVFETILVIILASLVRFCCIFWKKKKVQNQDLGKFFEKRCSLQIQKKVFDKTIADLKKKAAAAAEGSAGSQVVEELGDLVRGRENVERKLSTTYSLGRDTTTPRSKSLLPVSSSDQKSKSLSFRSGQKESVTIFHNLSNSNSSCSSATSSSVDEEMEKRLLKGKAPIETESLSSDDDDDDDDVGDDDKEAVEEAGVKIGDDGGGSMRRRSMSLTKNISSSSK